MAKKIKALIVGVANEHSIAWGCTEALYKQGADLILTYQNDKARAYVQPLADKIGALALKLDVTHQDELSALFGVIQQRWGSLDFLLHSIAFAPKTDLQGRVIDSSKEGFAIAMDVSCHSLARLAHAAEPFMKNGGSILTMSYYGAEKVIENYNLMGPVKAALEAMVRYLAMELGPQNIRVNALSPGPVKTRAATGLSHFDELMEKAADMAPLHHLVTIEQIGEMAAFLASDKAAQITGQTIYVDNGYNIRG